MFKKMASDALGLSDIGQVIAPADYGKVDSDDYVMHEENEKIYFLIKSKSDEYCFTNRALIHLDGNSALSKKRMLKRLDYVRHPVSEVALETAGTIDMDIEIKFTMGGVHYSIDVNKNQIEQLKDLYKALVSIAAIQRENLEFLQYSEKTLSLASNSVRYCKEPTSLVEQFQAVNRYAFDWLKDAHRQYCRKDFGDVYEKFIHDGQPPGAAKMATPQSSSQTSSSTSSLFSGR